MSPYPRFEHSSDVLLWRRNVDFSAGGQCWLDGLIRMMDIVQAEWWMRLEVVEGGSWAESEARLCRAPDAPDGGEGEVVVKRRQPYYELLDSPNALMRSESDESLLKLKDKRSITRSVHRRGDRSVLLNSDGWPLISLCVSCCLLLSALDELKVISRIGGDKSDLNIRAFKVWSSAEETLGVGYYPAWPPSRVTRGLNPAWPSSSVPMD
ncbi:hypothetical protein Tco_0328388 [Tanacetum coccineum]